MVCVTREDIGEKDRGKKVVKVDRNTVILVDPKRCPGEKEQERRAARYRNKLNK